MFSRRHWVRKGILLLGNSVIMGAACCCLRDDWGDYANPNNSIYRNCICLHCFVQNFLYLVRVLVRWCLINKPISIFFFLKFLCLVNIDCYDKCCLIQLSVQCFQWCVRVTIKVLYFTNEINYSCDPHKVNVGMEDGFLAYFQIEPFVFEKLWRQYSRAIEYRNFRSKEYNHMSSKTFLSCCWLLSKFMTTIFEGYFEVLVPWCLSC